MTAFSTAGGRVGGAADSAVAVHQSFPTNHTRAGEFVVGVVDTGLALVDGGPHPWLAGHIGEYDADKPIPSGGSTMLGKQDGHGTTVCGLILREAPAAKVSVLRPVTWEDDKVAEAIGRLTGHKLINLSFAGLETRTTAPAQLKRALERLDPDAVVVISAGNQGNSKFPAALELAADRARIIAVGAVDETRTAQVGAPPQVAAHSLSGPWVDCYANGAQVLGPHCYFTETAHSGVPRAPQDFRGWALWSGSSFAAATVTGRIAKAITELGMSARAAADFVLGKADLIPVPNDEPADTYHWRPFVRGVASTWGTITVPAPTS